MKAALICLVLLIAFVFGSAWGDRFGPPMLQAQVDRLEWDLSERFAEDDTWRESVDKKIAEFVPPPRAEPQAPAVVEVDPHGEQISQLSQELQRVTQENVVLNGRITTLEQAPPPVLPPDPGPAIAAIDKRVKTLEGQPKVDPETIVTLDTFNQRFVAKDGVVENLQTQMQVVEESNLRRDKDIEEMKKLIQAIGFVTLFVLSAPASAESATERMDIVADLCPLKTEEIDIKKIETMSENTFKVLIDNCRTLKESGLFEDLYFEPAPDETEVGDKPMIDPDEPAQLAGVYGKTDKPVNAEEFNILKRRAKEVHGNLPSDAKSYAAQYGKKPGPEHRCDTEWELVGEVVDKKSGFTFPRWRCKRTH